jgi:hypothetical protein
MVTGTFFTTKLPGCHEVVLLVQMNKPAAMAMLRADAFKLVWPSYSYNGSPAEMRTVRSVAMAPITKLPGSLHQITRL